MIYVDINGTHYVKGDLGGGYTINSDKCGVWDYCSIPEEFIVSLCKNTKKHFKN